MIAGPSYSDDYALDGIVRAVALDWRDFGRDKAANRLQYELDHRNIGAEVGDENCELSESEGAKTVRCSWTANIGVSTLRIPINFRSEARISPEGALE